jgi:hypothetical protein
VVNFAVIWYIFSRFDITVLLMAVAKSAGISVSLVSLIPVGKSNGPAP